VNCASVRVLRTARSAATTAAPSRRRGSRRGPSARTSAFPWGSVPGRYPSYIWRDIPPYPPALSPQPRGMDAADSRLRSHSMTAGLDRDTPDAVLDALAELAGQYLPPETLLAFDARVGFPEEAVRRISAWALVSVCRRTSARNARASSYKPPWRRTTEVSYARPPQG
jgi:hypothetical protein